MDTRISGHFSHSLATSMSRRTALRRASLTAGATALLAAAWSQHGDAAQEEGLPKEWFAPEATVGSHGMVIVGEGPVYLSHLPAFMFDTPQSHPHHYQVIVEVAFDDAVLDAYLADRRETEAPLYTLWPQGDYAMLDLIMQGLSDSAIQTIDGDIIRGHWERRGEPQPFGITWEAVAEGVSVAVKRVIYAHEFSLHPGSLDQLEYVLFGAGDEVFLAHRITAAPDFDQILPVKILRGMFPIAQLREGIVVAIPERKNSIGERLMAGDQVTAAARLARTGVAIAPHDPDTGLPIAEGLQLEAGQEIFFEEGELGFTFDMDPTQAEIDAGFAFP